MTEPYVARIPIKLSPGTNLVRDQKETEVLLYPGDELPSFLSEDAVLQLRQSGSAVPKPVWEALHAAENARERADAAQRAAEDEMTQQMIKSSL